MGRKSKKKLSLKERWAFATWFGIDAKTNEHVVVIGEGGAAICVKTVLRLLASDKWNVCAKKAMQASLRVPNPENLRQAKVMPERLTKKIEVEGSGSKIQEQVRRLQNFKLCEFKITKGILEKFGLSDNCKGCEAAASQSDARHTHDCRQKLEQLIRGESEAGSALCQAQLRGRVRKNQASRRIEGG